MSLINDALRRAKQANKEASAPPPIEPAAQFRPVEPAPQPARHGLGVMLPFSLASIALLGLVLFWEISNKNDRLVVAAKSPASTSASPATPAADPSVPANTATSPTTATEHNAAEPVVPIKESALAQPAASSSNSNSPVAVADNGETNHSALVEPPALPPLKLQSIVYNPRRPSAMINGRVVFVGERMREYRVLAIHPDNVVLTGAGQTNVLSLEP